jgi:hypothetical protein
MDWARKDRKNRTFMVMWPHASKKLLIKLWDHPRFIEIRVPADDPALIRDSIIEGIKRVEPGVIKTLRPEATRAAARPTRSGY